jgi:hypothetical protein
VSESNDRKALRNIANHTSAEDGDIIAWSISKDALSRPEGDAGNALACISAKKDRQLFTVLQQMHTRSPTPCWKRGTNDPTLDHPSR